MTLAARAVPDLPEELRDDPAESAEDTAGGGGMTSCVPKSLPITLLTNDPLAACVGGGGTTAGAEERTLPLSMRRRSRGGSGGGGGAPGGGGGGLSFAGREGSLARAETGGGTMAWWFIAPRVGETPRATVE